MSRCVCTLPDQDETACTRCHARGRGTVALLPVDLDTHSLILGEGIYTIIRNDVGNRHES